MEAIIGRLIVYVDERRGLFIGRVERWERDALTLLLADQEHRAADLMYEHFFYARFQIPEPQTFYFWPQHLLALTFSGQALPGNWKRIPVPLVFVISHL